MTPNNSESRLPKLSEGILQGLTTISGTCTVPNIGGVHTEPHLLQGSINPSKSSNRTNQPNHTDHEIVPTDHKIRVSHTLSVYP